MNCGIMSFYLQDEFRWTYKQLVYWMGPVPAQCWLLMIFMELITAYENECWGGIESVLDFSSIDGIHIFGLDNLSQNSQCNSNWLRKWCNKAWTKPGQSLDKAWTKPGCSLDKAWTRAGQSLDKTETKPGQSLDKAWTKPGQSLDMN